METLLDIYLLENNQEALSMVKSSLKAMSTGGIYDHIEGGFYRYSTYSDWIIPHFEKMLYTQAELISLYVKFYILFPEPRYRGIVLDTIKELTKDLVIKACILVQQMLIAKMEKDVILFTLMRKYCLLLKKQI